MQKVITALFALILFGGGILFAYSLVQKSNQPIVVAPSEQAIADQVISEPAVETEDIPEDSSQVEIPEVLKEQLSVSDISVRETSIANNPDIWRAFINSDIGHSDPTFVFGCEEYLDTGGQLLKDLFVDQADQVWVADVAGGELIGIGQIDRKEYALIHEYAQVDKQIACLALSNLVYSNYQLYTTRVELLTTSQQDEYDFPAPYELTVLVNNTYLSLPSEVTDELDFYTGAGREPILVANRFIVGFGEFGISYFDLSTWQLVKLFGIDWGDTRGVSMISVYKTEPLIAFAHAAWEGPEAQPAVYVYDLTNGKNYQQYRRYAQLGWMMGSNEIFSLENPADIQFIDQETLRIVEYPNFNEDVTNGDDPYLGETEIFDWKFLAK